ncbi:MAG TPA: DNA polymerase III subunit gamma/tau [Verrucomicrobiota bacterium]|nr:DNA polymerase III subunit gamma/tau [Verrucomicrobiota bacterium]
MSYLVIARKYRPQRFEDVVGQEHVTQTLANAIKMGRIAHAYLFCGPRGTGKTTIARIFAKCLNCINGPRVDFDDNDPRCKEIAEGNSLDVIEIDGASNNGVEQVRQLRDAVRYAPAVSRFKIYIIDEVHMLTQGAFNALLKTLEEPPPHVKFMFATTDPEKIPPTVLSRCQRFDLRRIPVRLIVSHLSKIAKNEGIDIEQAALFAIARNSEGCMRDAEGMLDQLISFCGTKIVEADVLAMFGITSTAQISELAGAIINSAPQQALKILNDLSNSGKEMTRLVADLLSYFRNILILKVSNYDTSLIDATEEELKLLKTQSESLTPDVLTRIMQVLSDCEMGLRDAVSRKILVELSLVKAIQERSAVSADLILKHLQRLREEDAGASVEPSKSLLKESEEPKYKSAVATNKAVEPAVDVQVSTAPTVDEKATPLQQLWSQLIEGTRSQSSFLPTLLGQCQPVSLEENVLTVSVSPDILGLLDDSKNLNIIKGILSGLGHSGVEIKFAKVKPQSEQQQPTQQPHTVKKTVQQKTKATTQPSVLENIEKPVSVEDFKNDPLIKEALERFRGKIIDVKNKS